MIDVEDFMVLDAIRIDGVKDEKGRIVNSMEICSYYGFEFIGTPNWPTKLSKDEIHKRMIEFLEKHPPKKEP